MSERTMLYGKGDVFVYRTYATPLKGVRQIPESTFTGRSNTIFGMDIQVSLAGKAFLTSFTEGDNSKVVATDSMKNFILHHAGEYEGTTMEGFLAYVSACFLDTYDHISEVEMSGRQFPFEAVEVGSSAGVVPSETVFREGMLEKPGARLKVGRDENGEAQIGSLESAVHDLHLIKVKGSSFAGFIRDDYTTLPETKDRPLFIYLNISWTYKESEHALGSAPEQYVAAEQVKHIAQTLFHQEDSPSIQKLIYDIGIRVLERFPQLDTVSFESNNRTWETVRDEIPASGEGKVFTDPRPPFGFQKFTVLQEDVKREEALR